MSGERGNPLLKRVDRWVGIPLVATLGASRVLLGMRTKVPPSLRGKHVGVLSPAAIGDTVLASGMVHDLTTAGARVTLITSPSNQAIAPLMPHVARTISVPMMRPHVALLQLRRERFDVIIDIAPWPRLNALLTALAGAKFTVGFCTPNQYRHYAYDAAVPHSHEVHQWKNCAALLRPFGIQEHSTPRFDEPSRLDLPPALPRRYVVFHAWPGGFRSEYREWPFACWAELATEISCRGLPIVLTGGKADRPRAIELAERLEAAGVEVINMAGEMGLTQTASVLAYASGVVTVDTGILHVASAVNAPVIGLHGPSQSRRWGALGQRGISVDAPGADAGFLSLGFEYPRNPPHTMPRIQAKQVWRLLKRILDSESQRVA